MSTVFNVSLTFPSDQIVECNLDSSIELCNVNILYLTVKITSSSSLCMLEHDANLVYLTDLLLMTESEI